jgi:hypothetical protein
MRLRRLLLSAWVFTPHYAIDLPKDWKVLSQSDLPGVGHELVVGVGPQHYMRVFRSGDKLSTAEFRQRMKDVVAEAKQSKKGKLLGNPEVVNFGKDGARLRMVFKTRIRERDYFEAHMPVAVGGQGLDFHFVAPLASHPASLKEAEGVFKDFRPYWTGETFDHPKGSGKP